MDGEQLKQGEGSGENESEDINAPENLAFDIRLDPEQSKMAHNIIAKRKDELGRKLVELEKSGNTGTPEYRELDQEYCQVKVLLDKFYSNESDDDESDWVDDVLKIRSKNTDSTKE